MVESWNIEKFFGTKNGVTGASSWDGWAGTSVSSNSMNGWATARPWPGALWPRYSWYELLECSGRLEDSIVAWKKEKVDDWLPVVLLLGAPGFAVKIDVKSPRIARAVLSFARNTTSRLALVVWRR
jgi:hypothetical protein